MKNEYEKTNCVTKKNPATKNITEKSRLKFKGFFKEITSDRINFQTNKYK